MEVETSKSFQEKCHLFICEGISSSKNACIRMMNFSELNQNVLQFNFIKC